MDSLSSTELETLERYSAGVDAQVIDAIVDDSQAWPPVPDVYIGASEAELLSPFANSD